MVDLKEIGFTEEGAELFKELNMLLTTTTTTFDLRKNKSPNLVWLKSLLSIRVFYKCYQPQPQPHFYTIHQPIFNRHINCQF